MSGQTCAGYFLNAHDAKWTNSKHRAQWTTTLETYAYPHFGDLPVADAGTAHVLAALEPIWREKPETATRVRGRVEAVLNYAATREWRAGENPARWRGHHPTFSPPVLPWPLWSTMQRCPGQRWGPSWWRYGSRRASAPVPSNSPS